MTAENNGTANYYAPEGYRGVKNLLIRFSTEKQNEIKELNTAITSANKTLTDAQKQLAHRSPSRWRRARQATNRKSPR